MDVNQVLFWRILASFASFVYAVILCISAHNDKENDVVPTADTVDLVVIGVGLVLIFSIPRQGQDGAVQDLIDFAVTGIWQYLGALYRKRLRIIRKQKREGSLKHGLRSGYKEMVSNVRSTDGGEDALAADDQADLPG
jgi:hypothetical protein